MDPDALLPRRPFLGLELFAGVARSEREKRDVEDGSFEGVLVKHVAEGGSAALAGICSGDRLRALDGTAVTDPRLLVSRLRTLSSGAPLTFEILREGLPMTLSGVLTPLPVERIVGATVHPGEVNVHGSRLRTFLTLPHIEDAASGLPRTSLLYLSGLGTGSCELSSDANDPMRKFFEGITRAGHATMRVERSGVGDSEGPPCQTTSFFDEVLAYRAALQWLASHNPGGKVVLFGHSMGGMIAPLLAGAEEGGQIEGVILFGTSALPWYDCIVRATRRQRMLAGLSGEELETYVAAWAEMHASVCREGMTPAAVFARRPELRWIEGSSCHGETMFGRHASFFEELSRVDLGALWRTTEVPVLVLHGENDFVVGKDEGEMIAEEINASSKEGPNRARFMVLKGIGHDMRRHRSLKEAFDDPRKGHWDDGFVDVITEWIEEIRGPRRR